MKLPDWIVAACDEIAGDTSCCDISSSSAWSMAKIVAKHAPPSAVEALAAIADMPVERSDVGDRAWDSGHADGRNDAYQAIERLIAEWPGYDAPDADEWLRGGVP